MSLAETPFLDHASSEVTDFVNAVVTPGLSSREQAVQLYYAVRDGLSYEVYGADLSRDGLRASSVLRSGSGMCLHKSVTYAATLRAIGVPSRLVLTDVRNHLASPRLLALIEGDVFHQHCLTEVHLDGEWVRATPVFNRLLCRLYGIRELKFDGTADSVHHPFDMQGHRSMEIVREHGAFDDLPYDLVLADLRQAHPRLFDSPAALAGGRLRDEA